MFNINCKIYLFIYIPRDEELPDRKLKRSFVDNPDTNDIKTTTKSVMSYFNTTENNCNDKFEIEGIDKIDHATSEHVDIDDHKTIYSNKNINPLTNKSILANPLHSSILYTSKAKAFISSFLSSLK